MLHARKNKDQMGEMSYEEMVMNYTITDVTNNVVTVEFEDGSWAQIVPTENMTEQDFDELVLQFAPKTGVAPAFIQVGQSRTAQPKPEEVIPEEVEVEVEEPQWLQDRMAAYGSSLTQLEYITENGLEAWQTHVAEIKAMIPKE